MPIQKFKNFEDAEQALWAISPCPQYYKNIAEFWKTANQLCTIRFPHGLLKFRSLQEANDQMENWLLHRPNQSR